LLFNIPLFAKPLGGKRTVGLLFVQNQFTTKEPAETNVGPNCLWLVFLLCRQPFALQTKMAQVVDTKKPFVYTMAVVASGGSF